MKSRIALLAATAFLLIACNSSTSTDDKGGTKTELLVGKNWKPVSAVLDPGVNIGGVTVTDWFAQLEDCDKDGTLKFNANGTYAEDEGTLKCDSDAPQTLSGTWVFNPGETIITRTETGGTPESATLVTLTAKSLVFSIIIDDAADGLKHKLTLGYSLP